MRIEIIIATIIGTASFVLVSACGTAATGAGPQLASSSDVHSNDAPTDVPSPPSPWAEMNGEDRRAWMVNEVMPRMSALFQEHDAERYADFGCATCHGPNARARQFEMPSPALPALHPTGSEEQHQMAREYPEALRFMFRQVMPTMQTLLGQSEFDAATGEGWSCYGCHPHAGDEGTTPLRLRGGDPAEP